MTLKKDFVAAIIIFLLGLIFGWFLWQAQAQGGEWLHPAAPPAPQPQTSGIGYCCATFGSRCIPTEHPSVCFRAGGKAYHAKQPTCDYFCTNATH